MFKVVQPWGNRVAHEATVLSEHPTVTEAFAAIDALAARMQETGAPSDAVHLVVLNSAGRIVYRPGTH